MSTPRPRPLSWKIWRPWHGHGETRGMDMDTGVQRTLDPLLAKAHGGTLIHDLPRKKYLDGSNEKTKCELWIPIIFNLNNYRVVLVKNLSEFR